MKLAPVVDVVRERPILFRPILVRAILDGKKTQTRRVAKDVIVHHTHCNGRSFCSGSECSGDDIAPGLSVDAVSPYGAQGNRLWVREAWHPGDAPGLYCYLADKDPADPEGPGCTRPSERWRPSIHMPRAACRLVLRIENVRLERLQDINEEDAQAEGSWTRPDFRDTFPDAYAHAFHQAWDDINTKRGHGWDTNPWVWAITFRRVSQ